jgi:uridine kinase
MSSVPLSNAQQAESVTRSPAADVPGRRPVGQLGLTDEALRLLASVLARWQGESGSVTVVAIDGHGASGKSTIAAQLCELSGASVVHTDDFFAPDLEIPADGGGRDLESYYDLAKLRSDALAPLRAHREACYHPFNWDTGTTSLELTHVVPTDIVILEGVYSGSFALADVVDKAICVHTPEPERLGRLRGRIAPEDWDSEWLRAEEEYFAGVRPLETFDLVIRGSCSFPLRSPPARAPFGGRPGGNVTTSSRER